MFTVKTNNATGFKVEFANGNKLSVQWRDGLYCEKRFTEEQYGDRPDWSSKDCEVYATNKDGKAHWFTESQVEGWVTPERLVEIMMFVSTSTLDTVGEQFKYNGD